MKRMIQKVICIVISLFMAFIFGAVFLSKIANESKEKLQNLSDKHLSLYLLMTQWVKCKQEGKSIETYLASKGYREIAIYGMNHIGNTLLAELKGSCVHVAYAIDKNADSIYSDINIINMEGNFKKVDAIIVTPITYYEDIKEELSTKTDCSIISIEDILFSM